MSEVLGSWRVTYTPGSWLVLCGPTCVVVLEPADPSWSDLVETLWDEVLASSSIGDVAARLATYRIDAMPSFAAFFWDDDGMRSLVRGEIRVVDADTDEVVGDGAGVRTWAELGLFGLQRVRVDLPSESDPSAYALPVVVGVVAASTLLLDASEGARASSPQGAWEADDQAPYGEYASDEAYGEDEVGSDNETSGSDDEAPGSDDEAPTEADVPVEDEEDDGAATQLVDAFAEEREHENASTSLMTIPPVLPDPEPEVPAAAAVPQGPSVSAVLCQWGHANAPGSERCRICDAPIAVQQARAVPVPVLAVLRASNGDVVDVDRAVLVGRAPSPDRSSVADPELLTLTSPSHDISRTHLEITPSDWQVVVTDLHSTNGTVLVAPDGSARQLGSGESAVVALGTAIELADGVSVLVDHPQ